MCNKLMACASFSYIYPQGDITGAIEVYTDALTKITNSENKLTMLASTLCSNRAMCHLKMAEAATTTSSSSDREQSLTACIRDCDLALDIIDICDNKNSNLQGKVLYRRAKALLMKIRAQTNNDTINENLRVAEKDLLQFLSFKNVNKEEGTVLLREVRLMQFNQFLRGIEEDIDIDTFTLPPRDDCPICMTTFPIDCTCIAFQVCCGKLLCSACYESTFYGGIQRGIQGQDVWRCLMCREFPWTGQDVSDGDRGDIPLVEAHAAKGNKDAMYNLAYRYVNGIKAPRDVIRGLDMYHMAAVAGHYHACRELGDMYFYGKNVMKSSGKALMLYIAAIRLGDPASLYKYGKIQDLMKENNIGDVPDDLPKKYFLKSASAGYEPALDKVKDLYTTNDATKQEYSDALRLYQSAHDEINSEARKRFLKRRANNSALLDDESDGLKKIAGIMKTIQSREI